MTRSSRSKSRTSKIQEIEDNAMTKHDNSKDLNGGVVLDHIEASSDSAISVDLTKKRNALACGSTNLNSFDTGPPTKKRHVIEMPKSNLRAQKRPNESSYDGKSNSNRTKLQKIADKTQRSWTKNTNTQSLNSNSDTDGIHRNFVVVSYNIASMSVLFNSCSLHGSLDFDLEHNLLMDEFAFINADILCLQYVSTVYWEILKKSLNECGYRGDIIIGDDTISIGVATLYRAKRFVQLTIDSDKLSKLCFKNIPHNSGLDDITMTSIKQYLDEPEPYILTLLQDREHERLLIVGNTLLSDDKSDKPDLKCVQAAGLFWRIYDMVCQIKSDQMNNNSSQSVQMSSPCWILCGDFNGSMDSPVYQICRDGYPNVSSIEQLQAIKAVLVGTNNQSLVDLIWHSFQHPLTDSVNSYIQWPSKSSNGYIWVSEAALKTEKVLLPNGTGCGQSTADVGAGNDHLSLACGLAFMT